MTKRARGLLLGASWLVALGGAATIAACASEASPPAPAATTPGDDAVDGGPDRRDGGADATVSDGCARGSGYPAGTSVASVRAGGVLRSFRVHVPPGYASDRPAPVVLMLHGGGGSGLQLENASSKMDPIADREGFIAIYPDGSGAVVKTWNGGGCCGKAAEDDVDDVAFIHALLDDVESKLCTDKKRVYAAGMSNGAILSHRLGCELSERLAAIAPVAGTIMVPSCAPAAKVGVFVVHGTDDGHVPWDGGVGCGLSSASFTSVPATLEGWRDRNGCGTTTTTSFTQGDGTCVAYDGCEAPVVLCTVAGGGHSWPGGVPKANDGGGVVDCPADGPQSTTFIASEAIWSFFKANAKR